MTRSQVQVDVPYEHPPVLPRGAIVVGAGIIGAGVLVVLQTEASLSSGQLLAVLGVVGLLLAVIAAAALPGTMRHITVAVDGMYVSGRMVLPARRIGDVQQVGRADAASTSWPASRPSGARLPTRQNLYGGLFGTGPAVAVVDEGPSGEASLWLIPSRDPEGLVAALVAVRDSSR